VTLVDEPRAGAARPWRRMWDLPLRAHLAALAAVLLALVPLVGTGASFSADEGAAILQARSLADGRGWVVEHPLPEADPGGRHYPLELSAKGPDGTAPFAKHPLYALLLAAADRIGGVTAMLVLSVLGTVAAAGLAAALAGHLDAALRRPALWVTGLASPLLFDGYLVIAHTLGAACAAGALVLAVRAVERRSLPAAVGVAGCTATAALVRTEAVLFAAALAAVAAALALADRRARVPALAVGAAAAGAAIAARVVEAAWARHLVGGTVTLSSVPRPEPGFLDGRLQSLLLTWLRPSYGGPRIVDLALLCMVAALAVGAVVARRRPGDRAAVRLCGAVAAVSAVAALLVGPTTVVPGMLAAFPVMVAGLLLLRRRSLDLVAARLMGGTFALFALAVIATQYSTGGSGEWGGRYFALGIPAVVPVVLLAVRDRGPALVAGLAICSVALSAMGVLALRSTHRFTADLVASIAAAATGPAPVIVTTEEALPRLAWATFDRQRWLLAEPADLPELIDRLRAAGVRRFAFVTSRLDRDRDHLRGVEVVSVDGRADGRGWQILVLLAG
jgi:hypothetical protein